MAFDDGPFLEIDDGEFNALDFKLTASSIPELFEDSEDQHISSRSYWARVLPYRESMLRSVEQLVKDGEVYKFEERFRAMLYQVHSLGAHQGRVRAGGAKKRAPADKFLGDMAAAEDILMFGDKFIADIVNERYLGDDGKLKPGAINHRAQMYISKATRGTANRSWVKESIRQNPRMKVDWDTTTLETGCETCPIREANSPYLLATLTFWPGDCTTECFTNCQCILTREDGIQTFLPEPPALGIYNG